MIHQSLAFDTGSGMLIAVPIPESSQADGETIERAIRAALTLADQQNIRGRDVTPFVLSQVNRLTSGASLTASKFVEKIDNSRLRFQAIDRVDVGTFAGWNFR